MQAKLLFLLLFFITYYQLPAQESKTYRVKAGEIPEKVIPNSDKYRYKTFLPGSVLYKNDKSSPAKLNYNRLLNEMQMITQKGDTLSLANEIAIKQVTVGDNFFYYDVENGYVEMLDEYAPVKLTVQRVIKVIRSERTGGYGQSSGVSAIRNFNSLTATNSQIFKLQSPGDLVLADNVSYFMIDQNSRFHLATKSNILRLFSEHKKTIDKYIKENRININKEEDLKKLLEFCTKLA
jgi:hypothetical protein